LSSFKELSLYLFLILYFYFPTVLGGGEMKIIVLLVYCFFVVFGVFINSYIDRKIYVLLFFSMLAALSIVISTVAGSLYWNDYNIHVASLLRVFYFLFLFLLFHITISSSGERGLLTLVYVLVGCLGIQVVIVLAQAFGFSDYVGMFYTQDKMKDLSSYMRATGTFGNPNILAIVSIISAALIFFIDKSSLRYIGMLLSAIIILFAGSRTGLVAYIILVAGVSMYLIINLRWYAKALYAFGVTFVLAFISVNVIFFQNNMPYLWSLIKLIDDPVRVLEINSFSVRLSNWQDKMDLFGLVDSIWVWFFGVGMHKSYYVLDNDYLYLFLRTGIVGFVTFYAFIFSPLFVFGMSGQPKKNFKYLFFLLLVIGFLWSFMFEYFNDFIMPVLFYLAVSLVSYSRKKTV
jgi:hypothetical protein